MRIIIEGCDGTGKTSVALKLAEIYKENILYMTRWGKKEFLSYVSHYSTKVHFISDRSFISELVYSKVFNRKCGIDNNEISVLLKMLSEFDYKVVVLTCDIDEIKRRLDVRNDESESILQNIEKIQDGYKKVAKQLELCVVDTTNKTLEQIVDEIQRRVLNESK